MNNKKELSCAKNILKRILSWLLRRFLFRKTPLGPKIHSVASAYKNTPKAHKPRYYLTFIYLEDLLATISLILLFLGPYLNTELVANFSESYWQRYD